MTDLLGQFQHRVELCAGILFIGSGPENLFSANASPSTLMPPSSPRKEGRREASTEAKSDKIKLEDNFFPILRKLDQCASH